MKTYEIKVSHHTLDYLFRAIAERCERSRKNYEKGDMDGAATRARLLSDNATELAFLLTQIARTMEE